MAKPKPKKYKKPVIEELTGEIEVAGACDSPCHTSSSESPWLDLYLYMLLKFLSNSENLNLVHIWFIILRNPFLKDSARARYQFVLDQLNYRGVEFQNT